jgi:pilus assembly protein Flp/PilA
MKNLITRFQNDESGATAIEYGLIAGLVSVVIILAITIVGTQLDAIFDKIGAALKLAATTATTS